MSTGWRYAFSLSKDEVAAAAPPGTSLLVEHDAHQGDHVQLIPPPSRSGADPLNVRHQERHMAFHRMLIEPAVVGMAQVHCTYEQLALRLHRQFRIRSNRTSHPDTAIPARSLSRTSPRTTGASALQQIVAPCRFQRPAHRCFQHNLGPIGEHLWTTTGSDRQHDTGPVLQRMGRCCDIVH